MAAYSDHGDVNFASSEAFSPQTNFSSLDVSAIQRALRQQQQVVKMIMTLIIMMVTMIVNFSKYDHCNDRECYLQLLDRQSSNNYKTSCSSTSLV